MKPDLATQLTGWTFWPRPQAARLLIKDRIEGDASHGQGNAARRRERALVQRVADEAHDARVNGFARRPFRVSPHE